MPSPDTHRPRSDGPLAVVFDVDGTLVDSNYLHVVAWSRAFTDCGHSPPMAAIHHEVGKGASDAVRALLPEADNDEVEQIVERHAERFAELHGELRPLPGAR